MNRISHRSILQASVVPEKGLDCYNLVSLRLDEFVLIGPLTIVLEQSAGGESYLLGLRAYLLARSDYLLANLTIFRSSALPGYGLRERVAAISP